MTGGDTDHYTIEDRCEGEDYSTTNLYLWLALKQGHLNSPERQRERSKLNMVFCLNLRENGIFSTPVKFQGNSLQNRRENNV